MNKQTILQALTRLGQVSRDAGVRLETAIHEGSAMLLAYNSRDATKDIGALLVPREEGERFAAEVARELDLPDDWISGDVAQFISPTREAKSRLSEINGAIEFLVVHTAQCYSEANDGSKRYVNYCSPPASSLVRPASLPFRRNAEFAF